MDRQEVSAARDRLAEHKPLPELVELKACAWDTLMQVRTWEQRLQELGTKIKEMEAAQNGTLDLPPHAERR